MQLLFLPQIQTRSHSDTTVVVVVILTFRLQNRGTGRAYFEFMFLCIAATIYSS